MFFTKLLHAFSLGCPWFNLVASLNRSLTDLHPVDIYFLNDCSRIFGHIIFLMPCFLNFSLEADYSKSFFVHVFAKKLHYQSTILLLQFVALANML